MPGDGLVGVGWRVRSRGRVEVVKVDGYFTTAWFHGAVVEVGPLRLLVRVFAPEWWDYLFVRPRDVELWWHSLQGRYDRL
jgi:hypothetical protein